MDDTRIQDGVRNVGGNIAGAPGGHNGDGRPKPDGKLDQIADKVQNILGKAVDELDGAAIADRASAFVKQATTAGENVASAVQDAAQVAGAQVSDIGGRLYDEGRRTGQSIVRAIDEQPLAAVLGFAMLAYGIAYLVHRR